MSESEIHLLRHKISNFLGFCAAENKVNFEVQQIFRETDYQRFLIRYTGSEGDQIPAYFLLPAGKGPFPATLVHHQHNSERHFGKSEVCGLVGNPLQAFGPALARQGIAVLAPDSICFEDRRKNRTGTQPDPESDIDQHYNEMCYRILRGDTLMRKVLDDSAQAISLLSHHPMIIPESIGILGHSYGGNTALFHAALDERIAFVFASGAACSYQYRMNNQIGIEMASVIPGFAAQFEVTDLLKCIAPRPTLLVSAENDPFSQDAEELVKTLQPNNTILPPGAWLEHKRYPGSHALTQERAGDILEWIGRRANLQ